MKSSIEQFEEWFKPRKIAMQKRGISTIRIVRLHKKMLEAWQASRAAIEITLPDCDDYQSTWQHQDAAEIKIKELGLTVK